MKSIVLTSQNVPLRSAVAFKGVTRSREEFDTCDTNLGCERKLFGLTEESSSVTLAGAKTRLSASPQLLILSVVVCCMEYKTCPRRIWRWNDARIGYFTKY